MLGGQYKSTGACDSDIDATKANATINLGVWNRVSFIYISLEDQWLLVL